MTEPERRKDAAEEPACDCDSHMSPETGDHYGDCPAYGIVIPARAALSEDAKE